MPKELTVCGYEAFRSAVASNASTSKVVVAFYADPEADTVSWCPDCRNCDASLRKAVSKMPDDSVFIMCYVGDRPTWKDPNNSFRKELGVTSVPTFIKIGSEERLVDADCANENLTEQFFLA